MELQTQKTMYVSVPPWGTAQELIQLIRRLAVPREDEIQIMAMGLTFLKPLELCLLRALVEFAAARARQVLFEPPQKADTHNYLARMDFYAGLPDNVAVTDEIPRLQRRDRSDALIELSPIRCPEDVERLMQRVRQVTRRVGGASIANACAVAVTEACANAVDHAESPVGGFIAAQRYPSWSGLELAVVDLGVGIAGSLAKNPEYRGLSELRAVERALEPGVSSIAGDPGRGAGLPSLVQAAASAGRSALRIRSGAAEVSLQWESDSERREQVIHKEAAIGTAIWLRIELQ